MWSNRFVAVFLHLLQGQIAAAAWLHHHGWGSNHSAVLRLRVRTELRRFRLLVPGCELCEGWWNGDPCALWQGQNKWDQVLHVDPAAFLFQACPYIVFLFFPISLFFFWFHAKAGVWAYRCCPPQTFIGHTGLEGTTFRMVSEVYRAGVQTHRAWLVLTVEVPHVGDTGGELTAITYLLVQRPWVITIDAHCVASQRVFPRFRDFINRRDFTVTWLIRKEQRRWVLGTQPFLWEKNSRSGSKAKLEISSKLDLFFFFFTYYKILIAFL